MRPRASPRPPVAIGDSWSYRNHSSARERPVEPHRVVERGHVEAALTPQRLHRDADGVQEGHVARVGEGARVHERVVAQWPDGTHPHRAARLRVLYLLRGPAQSVHVPDVERLAARHALQRLGKRAQMLGDLLRDRRK